MKTWWVHGPSGVLHRAGVRPRRWIPKGKATFYLRHGHRVYLLSSLHRKGICVIAMWDMCSAVGHLDPPAYRWEWPSMKKKLGKLDDKTVKHLAALESKYFEGLLPLIEHCAVRQYDDGDPRETGWVTIKTNGSAWMVQVKDPDSCTSFAAVGDSVDKALETAALLLSCDDAPWEHDRYLQDAKKRKKG